MKKTERAEGIRKGIRNYYHIHQKRDKCGVAIAPQLVRMCDEISERYGIRSRNDFVEQAMRFYIDALVNGEESVWAYLNLYSRYETENRKYQPIER